MLDNVALGWLRHSINTAEVMVTPRGLIQGFLSSYIEDFCFYGF